MNNWKTTIGGALSALGTSIAGISTVGAFMADPEYKKLALYCIIGGATISALGKFFGGLFAADKPSADQSSTPAETAGKKEP